MIYIKKLLCICHR